MTEEVEGFGGSRWEVQDIKVLAGWPAKPQTPCQPLVAWLYNATSPRLRKNAPGSFERLSQRYASVDFGQRGQRGQLHFLERIGNL
jgi:hypothetical protein